MGCLQISATLFLNYPIKKWTFSLIPHCGSRSICSHYTLVSNMNRFDAREQRLDKLVLARRQVPLI